MLDAIFDPRNLINEVIWKRSTAHSDRAQGSKHFGRLHDTLLVYAKSVEYKWNQLYQENSESYINAKYKYVEPETGRMYRLDNLTGPGGAAKGNPAYEVMGITRYWRYSRERMQRLIKEGRVIQTKPGMVPQYKRYLDETIGRPLQDIWDDIPPINSQAQERLGYPTQKPEALLDRIIMTSSNEGDVVLDPFCGCGTAIASAQRLDRSWIGIDITHLAITLIKHRLFNAYGAETTYEVIGEPVSLPDAEQLAKDDAYQFQWWALGLVGARPVEKKKGADQGIDGRLYFHDDPRPGTTKQIILSVKSGHIPAAHIRELRGTVDRESAALGVLLTLEPPTRPMRKEAAQGGFYESPMGSKHPRIQILTIAELLDGSRIDYPLGRVNATFRRARRVKKEFGKRQPLPFDRVELPQAAEPVAAYEPQAAEDDD